MVYSKIWEFYASGTASDLVNGPYAAIRYIYKDFLETVGWTVAITGVSDDVDPQAYVDTNYYFKRTNTCVDGSTYDVHFAIEWEFGATDIMYRSWDGVKATANGSDPDYGLGPSFYFSDSSFGPLMGNRTYEIWKDNNSDGWFVRCAGKYIGGWFPDGGWVRQDYEYAEGADVFTRHPIPLICQENSNAMAAASGNSTQSIYNSLSYDQPNYKKLTDFVQLNAGNNAMWRDLNGRFMTRASNASIDPSQQIKTMLIDGEYWLDMGATAGWNSALLIPIGTEDPGF